MNATQLLAHFDRLAEAPNAVPRLRRFILDLAVRGKLVAQDPGDEPAVELLKRIRAEKLQFGNGRSSKTDLGEVKEIAEPFELPEQWIWTKLGNVADLVRGITFSASDKSTTHIDGTLPCFRSGNIQNEIVWNDFVFVPKTVIKSATQLVRANDILISIANSYELVGKSSIVTTVQKEATFGAFLTAIRLFLSAPQFIQHVLASGYSANAFRIGSSQTTNIANITFGTIRGHQIPLPPLVEQHRIVAKVDELMGLCDQLEAAQQERERRRDRLAAASLQRLNHPDFDATPEAQREHARFHLHHLPRLTTRPEHIKAIRQTIHNLAVRGKLVLQKASEQSARALLKQMQEQKNQLIEDGILPKSKNLAQIGAEEIPSVLPNTWCWTRIESVCAVIVDCPHSTATFIASGVICLDTNSFKAGSLTPHKIRYVSEATYQERIQRLEPQGGDVIFAREGSVGESVIVPTGMRCCLGQRVMLFRPLEGIVPSFFQLALSEPASLTRLLALHKGIGAKHVNVADMRNALLPLPPLAEQHRIVAKVDELMALCDQLEAQLTTTQTDSRRLLEAVLEAALAPA